LPTAKGIRLLGVTVSNFDNPRIDVADELPLFADEAASAPARHRPRCWSDRWGLMSHHSREPAPWRNAAIARSTLD
jgi:hypothetical protein